MSKFDSALSTNSDSKQTIDPAKLESNSVQYIVTTVAGTDETGVTIVAKSGEGIFHPDVTRNVTPAAKPQSSGVLRSVAPAAGPKLREMYPHWEESNEEVAIAINLVSKAIKDLENAAEIQCNSAAEILNYLVLAETQLFQALPKCRFNKAYEIVISFCAWAIRNAETGTGECPSIQGMCAALREVNENPFLKSNRATLVLIELERQGWSDVSTISQSFDSAFSARFDEIAEGSLI